MVTTRLGPRYKTRKLVGLMNRLSWYPRFPSIVVEALLLLSFLLVEEYLPSLSDASGEARKS